MQGARGGFSQVMYTCVVGLMLLKGRRGCHAITRGSLVREAVPLAPAAYEYCSKFCAPIAPMAGLHTVCVVACSGNLGALATAAEFLGRLLVSPSCASVHGMVAVVGGFVVPVLIAYVQEITTRRSWALYSLPPGIVVGGLSHKELATLWWSFGVVSLCYILTLLPLGGVGM